MNEDSDKENTDPITGRRRVFPPPVGIVSFRQFGFDLVGNDEIRREENGYWSDEDTDPDDDTSIEGSYTLDHDQEDLESDDESFISFSTSDLDDLHDESTVEDEHDSDLESEDK
uniref:RNA-directed DNA methylation 4 n=1 Tax=Caenorhabditis tropicalis TaxID=1561998 RepID=A0A1I7TRJ4_9PELO